MIFILQFRDINKFNSFFFKKIIFFLSFELDVTIKIFLFFDKLNKFKLVLIASLRSIIIRLGLFELNPSILQLSNDLSLFIDFEVEIIESYSDLIK